MPPSVMRTNRLVAAPLQSEMIELGSIGSL
jgi:hypothetical protein